MNARTYGIFGLAALGLALAGPVHAAPDFADGLIILVKQDRYDDRDVRRDDRYDDRRSIRRDDDDDDYGTGYERRKQKRDDRDDDDDDDRRRPRR